MKKEKQKTDQLALFPLTENVASVERWKYPLITLFHQGSSDLYYIEAGSRQEAIAIAEKQLRDKGIPFRNVASVQGTYWRKSIQGYPCSPINQADYWK